MKKPMEVSVVPATEQADRSVYEALAMMIVEFITILPFRLSPLLFVPVTGGGSGYAPDGRC